MDDLNIYVVNSLDEFDRRYFINLPIPRVVSLSEKFSGKEQVTKVEIPKSLAKMIFDLQDENKNLKKKIVKLENLADPRKLRLQTTSGMTWKEAVERATEIRKYRDTIIPNYTAEYLAMAIVEKEKALNSKGKKK